MDTLTFSAPILLRHLTFSEAKKQPISEINLKVALEGLDMDMSQVRHIYRKRLSTALKPISVHRPLHSSRLRLSRADKGRRSQICIEVDQGAW